jgi:hypothetical protein
MTKPVIVSLPHSATRFFTECSVYCGSVAMQQGWLYGALPSAVSNTHMCAYFVPLT